MEKLYSIEASTERLGGISPWTLRAWIAQGKLMTVKLGRRRMIPESEIERLVEQGRVPAEPNR